ncbi:MAG TPA: thioesterase [Spirochaetota bacterium]|nr:thioesterase [Spirochaetota bacterium]HPJ41585.1 thioesterase [Spirochaetota bacterium]HPR36854.1 thioesterase [Spirochaetota bacterium]
MSKAETGISEFDVRLYDCGPDGKAGIRTLFNFMQSTADNHSKSLGTSVNLMSERNLTWVYARFYAEIISYPAMYDTVKCETWRSGVTEGMVNREFIMHDSKGKEILRATSSLALIDRGTRKPVAIPDYIQNQFAEEKGRAVNYVAFPVDKPDKNDYIYNLRVRYEDIDINGHMNNASYAQMFFESGYSAIHHGAALSSIDILFKGEVLYDETIKCSSVHINSAGKKFYHSAFNEKRGRLSAVAVTNWR